MSLPRLLWLVRHGRSEMNEASGLLRTGDHSLITPDLLRRAAECELVAEGEKQARAAGAFIRLHGIVADVYLHSPLRRARQTAELALPGINWKDVEHFRERTVGRLEATKALQKLLLLKPGLKEVIDGYPEGETFWDVKKRVREGLTDLFTEYADKRVMIFSHHDVILTKHAYLARLSDERFQEVSRYGSPDYLRVGNGSIFEYCRVNPSNGAISPHFSHMRISNPHVSMKPGPWIELP